MAVASVNQDQGTLIADAIVSQICAKREIGSFVAPRHALLAEPTEQFLARRMSMQTAAKLLESYSTIRSFEH
jgi:hypothetical protein